MTAPTPIDPQLLQARLAHLATIQGVVTRLAGYSATVKNFALTAIAGLLGLAYGKPGTEKLMLAAFAFVLLFMLMDAYYLALERAFRAFHAVVCGRPLSDAMNQAIGHEGIGPSDFIRAVGSISVWMFYGPLFIVLGLLTFSGQHGHFPT